MLQLTKCYKLRAKIDIQVCCILIEIDIPVCCNLPRAVKYDGKSMFCYAATHQCCINLSPTQILNESANWMQAWTSKGHTSTQARHKLPSKCFHLPPHETAAGDTQMIACSQARVINTKVHNYPISLAFQIFCKNSTRRNQVQEITKTLFLGAIGAIWARKVWRTYDASPLLGMTRGRQPVLGIWRPVNQPTWDTGIDFQAQILQHGNHLTQDI